MNAQTNNDVPMADSHQCEYLYYIKKQAMHLDFYLLLFLLFYYSVFDFMCRDDLDGHLM